MPARLSFIAILVLAAAHIATSRTLAPKELLALEGSELCKAADGLEFEAEREFPTADLIAISQKLARLEKSPRTGDEPKVPFSRYFDAACAKADPGDLEKLVEIYVGLDPESFGKQFSFTPLAIRWIAHELTARPAWPQMGLPSPDTAPPPQLTDAPPEILGAWRVYRQAVQSAEPLLQWDRQTEHVSFQRNQRAFFSLIDNALLRRGDGITKKLAQFEWSGTSGTFSELLSEPKALGIFLALLTENRLLEAVGAAVNLTSDRPLTTDGGERNVRIEFLQKCGLDWETVFVGAVAELEDAHAFGLYRQPFLDEIAAYGSERAALLLVHLARRSKGEMRVAYARALSDFISGQMVELSVTRTEKKRYAAPISAETTSRIVEVLQTFATADAPPELAAAVLTGFARAKAPSTKPALRELLKHSSREVAMNAGDILRALGETIPSQKRGRVHFQLLANGKPLLEGSRVDWELRGLGGSLSSSQELGDAGILELAEDDLIDPERKINKIVFSQGRDENPQAPIFYISLPVPTDLRQQQRINVDTVPTEMNVAMRVPRRDDGEASAEVKISRGRETRDAPAGSPATEDSAELVFAHDRQATRQISLPLNTSMKLSIQRGHYDLEINSPGARTLRTTFTVGNDRQKLDFKLHPGGDLRFTIVRPDGEPGARFVLLHEGEPVDPEMFDRRAGRFRGLPTGNYVLRIPSSAEITAREGDDFAPLQPYAGRDVQVAITGESPNVIDLGEIRLTPAPQ